MARWVGGWLGRREEGICEEGIMHTYSVMMEEAGEEEIGASMV